MSESCAKLGFHFNTFKRHALKLGCYNANQGLKGGKRIRIRSNSIKLKDILDGKHPNFQTFKLKNKLLKSGIKKNECEICEIREWQYKPLNMELHHLDGNRTNHELSNLQMICPNCHSQTSTFRAKNKVEH